MKKILLLMLGVLLALPGLARDFTYTYEGQTLTYTVLDEEAKTCATKKGTYSSAGNKITGNLIIPSIAKDGEVEYSVTSISDYSFANSSTMESVKIPNSITTIGIGAFYYCGRLTSLIIPNSVISVGSEVCRGCSNLTSVIIGNSVTSIGNKAFEACRGLLKSAYPNRVGPDYLPSPFPYGLVIAYEPNGTIIEDGFIYGPEKKAIYFAPISLEGNYAIPESVTIVTDQAFRFCNKLTSLIIGNKVQSIGDHAFYNCSGISAVKSLPEIPPTMDVSAFGGLYDTALLTVPDATVNDYLSTSWSNFKSLKLKTSGIEIKTYSDGVLNYRLIPATKSGEDNLAIVTPGEYSTLTEVSIPEQITVEETGIDPESYYVNAIGYKAFQSCSKLTSISFNSFNKLKIIGDYAFQNSGITEINIPESVETIGTGAFSGASKLSQITLNEGLVSIGDKAFSTQNKNISDAIYIPSTVTTIGEDAFKDFLCNHVEISDLPAWCKIEFDNNLSNPLSQCGSLCLSGEEIKDLVIPKDIIVIKPYIFYNGKNLTSVTFNDIVKRIDKSSFYGCENLTFLVLSNTVQVIGNYAFGSCKSLTSISFPDALQEIGDGAFSGCSSLTSVTFNDALKSIGKSAFSYCSSLISVTFNEALKSIGEQAFRTCYNITTLAFNNSLQSIGDYAFYMCRNLTSAFFNGSLKTIGDCAFMECFKLKTITFAYGTDQIKIANNAFYSISNLSWNRDLTNLNLSLNNLESLTIGNDVTEIPASKFKNATNLATITLGSKLEAIGDEAFSGCIGLEEIVVPPSVSSIGASAFADNNKLNSIIIGYNVKTVGENAFNGCPASTVSITAQTPPKAQDNTFSNYTGKLYVQGDDAVNAYSEASPCWNRFDCVAIVEATGIDMGDSPKTINGMSGDTFQLSATLLPDNVTLPHLFWRSTNPDIATVDQNGQVTLHADMDPVMTLADDGTNIGTCKIIVESLYANGPVAEVKVNDNSIPTGIEDVTHNSEEFGKIDFSSPLEIYNLQGMLVSDRMNNLATGLYIVRQNKNVKKIMVK